VYSATDSAKPIISLWIVHSTRQRAWVNTSGEGLSCSGGTVKEQDLSFSFPLNKVGGKSLRIISPEYLADGLDHLFVAFWLHHQRVNDALVYLGIPQPGYF